jgi:hypothetical protein
MQLGDGDTSAHCGRWTARSIPFVACSDVTRIDGACGIGAPVNKPASASVSAATVAGSIERRQISN